MKCWDIGGQEQYRSEWSRYTKGCDVVLYVVDAAAPQKLPTARKELHKLLDDGSIGTTPMLVLANKIDLPEHVGEQELIEELALNYVVETPWMVLPISALRKYHIKLYALVSSVSDLSHCFHQCKRYYKCRPSCRVAYCPRQVKERNCPS